MLILRAYAQRARDVDHAGRRSPTANLTTALIKQGIESGYLRKDDPWQIAHPFRWTAKSFEKVLNNVDDPWRRRPHWSDVIKAPTLQADA